MAVGPSISLHRPGYHQQLCAATRHENQMGLPLGHAAVEVSAASVQP